MSIATVEELAAAAIEGRVLDDEQLSFEQLGLDSFDLIELRLRLEEAFGAFPDRVWLGFEGLSDIRAFTSQPRPDERPDSRPPSRPVGEADPTATDASPHAGADRVWRLNMPSMAVGGMSEGWLFRELGDLHWAKLCAGLGRSSDRILDAQGTRLYATFVRVRWQANACLGAWRENDEVAFTTSLSRLGQSVLVSKCRALGRDVDITADMMTTFSARGAGNQDLRKTTPANIHEAELPVLAQRPRFATDYHAARTGELPSLVLGGASIPLPSATLHTHSHAINPYYEINGVNLLYFASYPLISDLAERAVVHAHRDEFAVRGDWALTRSTIARDVFYFSNCNIDDIIAYQMNHWEYLDDGGRDVAVVSTLRRSSDDRRMALIVSIKRRIDD